MAKKVGVVLAVDGEKEFTQALSNARSEAANLKSAASLLIEQYRGNANSLEYLEKKQGNLTEQQAAYNKTLDAAREGQLNAAKNVDKQKEAVAKLETEFSKAKSELERMDKAGENNTKAYKDQEKSVTSLEEALKKQQSNPRCCR